MKSLAKPRKVTILGSDGQRYAFLGKPKDDLRKDARLMDFNSIINKILNMNSEEILSEPCRDSTSFSRKEFIILLGWKKYYSREATPLFQIE